MENKKWKTQRGGVILRESIINNKNISYMKEIEVVQGTPLLALPDKPIDSRDDFFRYLERRQLEEKIGANFQMIATISSLYNKETLVKSLETFGFNFQENYGNLYWFEMEASTGEDDDEIKVLPYFMFYDEINSIYIFLTRARKTDEMPETILRFINTTEDISNLWITPMWMRNIKNELDALYGNEFQISYFTAIRTHKTKIPAKVRPEISRSIQYTGEDAKETLNELEYLYGVCPKIIEAQLGITGFRIDNQGIFTLRSGGLLEPVFNTLELVIQKILPVIQAVTDSSYKKENIGGIERWIQNPWSIDIPNGVRVGLQEHFLREISDEKIWQFIPISPYIEEDVSYLSTRIVDGLKNSTFDLEIKKTKANIYPVRKMDVGSALRLNQFIVENEDVEASVLIEA